MIYMHETIRGKEDSSGNVIKPVMLLQYNMVLVKLQNMVEKTPL